MGSLLRTVKKCKKSRRLGEVEVVKREEYGGLEVDSKVEMIRALVPLGLMHVHELLDDEVKALAGSATHVRTIWSTVAVTEPTQAQWVWRVSGCRSGFPVFAAWEEERSRFARTRR